LASIQTSAKLSQNFRIVNLHRGLAVMVIDVVLTDLVHKRKSRAFSLTKLLPQTIRIEQALGKDAG